MSKGDNLRFKELDFQKVSSTHPTHGKNLGYSLFRFELLYLLPFKRLFTFSAWHLKEVITYVKEYIYNW